jgi:hypothetical protein
LHSNWFADGVGHKPKAIPLMGRSNVGSSHNSPARVIPERGKVGEDSFKSSMNEHWAVLHEDVLGSYFANHPRHVPPHAGALSVKTVALAGDADVLAGKAARNDVNNAAPWSSVKGLHVIPNRERREKPVVLPCDKYACCVGLPLDGAHGSPSKQVPAENSSTSAREKSQLMHALPPCFPSAVLVLFASVLRL